MRLVDGRVYFRAECRKKAGGKFEQLACWRLPPVVRDKWQCITGIRELEWTTECRWSGSMENYS
jgi:hypothetical protein